MKKLILTLALGVACVSAMAQGTVALGNAGAGLDAPVWLDSVGSAAGKVGAGFVAQLWGGPAGSAESALTAQGATTSFFTGAGAGYFAGGPRTVTGVAGGSVAVLQVRVWNTAAGATWAEANANPLGIVGASGLVNITLSVPPATPPNMVGLTSWAVVPVPEPSSFALAGLGAAAMLIFRRRK